jgi:hypothetical protein
MYTTWISDFESECFYREAAGLDDLKQAWREQQVKTSVLSFGQRQRPCCMGPKRKKGPSRVGLEDPGVSFSAQDDVKIIYGATIYGAGPSKSTSAL